MTLDMGSWKLLIRLLAVFKDLRSWSSQRLSHKTATILEKYLSILLWKIKTKTVPDTIDNWLISTRDIGMLQIYQLTQLMQPYLAMILLTLKRVLMVHSYP